MKFVSRRYMKRILLALVFCIASVLPCIGQVEILTNARIIEMSNAGLGTEIILMKIRSTPDKFDISTDSLIELKKGGVDNAVIQLMIDKSRAAPSRRVNPTTISATVSDALPMLSVLEPREMLRNARTISIQKSSLNPSRQALEKELLKRADWRTMNLAIEEYKDNADLYVDIGFVPLSLVTHRYVYRIYDRRSGAVIAAGETTSWGSLAANLARNISKSLIAVRGS
jgi:hypothetical protein